MDTNHQCGIMEEVEEEDIEWVVEEEWEDGEEDIGTVYHLIVVIFPLIFPLIAECEQE